jgi:hypothetical protein
MPQEPEPQPEPQRSLRSGSAASSSSQRTARSLTRREPPTGSVFDALRGIGSNPETQLPDIEMEIDDTQLDILSSGSGENYGNTQTQTPAPATLNLVAPNLALVNPDPYASFQHGALFLLGVLRDGVYHCQHLQLCSQRFDTPEDLQLHFESTHFYFTRIDPPQRHICSACRNITRYDYGPCSCRTPEFIELWICGHFIKTPWYQRHAPDGSDFQGYPPGSKFFDPTSYTGPNLNSPWDPSMNGANFNGGGNNQGQYNYQGGNGYGQTGNQGNWWNASIRSGSASNQYRGNFFGARQMAWDGPYTFHFWDMKAHQRNRRLKFLLLLFLLLLVVTLGFTHDWVISKARMAIPRATAGIRSHLAATGFVIIMATIAVCVSIQHLTVQRRARSVSITIILDQLARKHADEVLRELDVLCTLLHTLLYRLNVDRLDLSLLCVATLGYDTNGGSPHNFTLMPSTNHELQCPPTTSGKT